MAKIIVKPRREPPPRRVSLAGKIVAVDFDGTLCESKWPEIGAPNVPLIDALRESQRNGARLILWTCRTGEQLSAAVDWCRRFRLEFDAVNDNLPESKEAFGGDGRKIYADVYLDDKAVKPERMPKVKKPEPPFAPLGRLLRGYGVTAVELSGRTGWSYGKASARVSSPGSITLSELEIIRRKFEIPKAELIESLGGKA